MKNGFPNTDHHKGQKDPGRSELGDSNDKPYETLREFLKNRTLELMILKYQHPTSRQLEKVTVVHGGILHARRNGSTLSAFPSRQVINL